MALKAQAEANKVSDDADPLGDTETADVKGDKENEDVRKPNDLIKRGIIKPVQLNSDVTILPSNKVSCRERRAVFFKLLGVGAREFLCNYF